LRELNKKRKDNKNMSNDKNKSGAVDAVNRIPNERLEDLFGDAVRERLKEADCKLNIQEFDVKIRKEVGQPTVFVDMVVFGMGGDTTKDAFAKNDSNGNIEVVKGAGAFTIKLDDDSTVKFVFDSIVNLNATDYQVTYKLVVG
jgi:hypothetical protein